MGKLYYVPIIHHVDFGSMMLLALHKGKGALAKHLGTVDQFEDMLQERIPQFISDCGQDLSKLTIRVDGLVNGTIDPYWGVKKRSIDCDEALAICKEAAEAGSKVHKIVLGLCSLGARVHGTEDPDIISLWNGLARDCELDDATTKELIIDRDQFIAKSISHIGSSGKSALCFMGAAHNVPLRLQQREVVFDLVHPITRKDVEDTIPGYLGLGTYFDKLPLR